MLRTATALAAACVAFLGVAVATAPSAPQALDAAIAATTAARAAYAFDVDINSSKINWRAHFDPRSTPRLQLTQPALDSLPADQQHAFETAARHMEGLSWCASAEMAHITGMRVLHDDADTTTYSFQPTPESIRGAQARQFADRLRGELTLTKTNPDITHIHLFAPAPFNAMLVANLTRVDISITCATAPNGRSYAAETVSEIAGSALGQSFSERSVQRAHDLAPSS